MQFSTAVELRLIQERDQSRREHLITQEQLAETMRKFRDFADKIEAITKGNA